MAETRATIPDRELFKAAEVCEIAGVQSYVLRSWEHGVSRDLARRASPGGPRVYRRADVERILRIKNLVFSEGLTLAGARRGSRTKRPRPMARRRLRSSTPEAREKLGEIRTGLRALLDMLGDAHAEESRARGLRRCSRRCLSSSAAEGGAARSAGGAKKSREEEGGPVVGRAC